MTRDTISSLATLGMALIIGALAGCEKPSSSSQETHNAAQPALKLAYPVKRVIHDTAGRPLDGSIVGRSSDQLYVIRTADRMEFKIPLANLDAANQQFVQTLPIQAPPAGFMKESKEPPAKDFTGDTYVIQRHEEIKRLHSEYDVANMVFRSTTNQILQRTKESEMNRIRNEIIELEADIMRYRADNRK